MTPEEFARQCAEMRDAWGWLAGLLAMIALVSLAASLVFFGMAVAGKKGHGWFALIAFGIFLAILHYGTPVADRAGTPERVIYLRDFAAADYRAFLERMEVK